MLRYTPRQIAAWLEAGMELHRQDMAMNFALAALAAQGEGKAIKKQIEEFEAE